MKNLILAAAAMVVLALAAAAPSHAAGVATDQSQPCDVAG